MARALTSAVARKLSHLRTVHRGGRPKKPTACPKCGKPCPGARLAQVHCAA
jgi:hypothetical protein